jgi:hypothetical protein
MRTLQRELLKLQGALSTGVISKEDYKAALTDRIGRLLRADGKLAVKRSRVGTEVNCERVSSGSQVAQKGHSRSVKIDRAQAAPEVRARDMLIKAGQYPVRVVRGVRHADSAIAIALKAAVCGAE